MKKWNLDTIAKVGTASVSFVTLALLVAGFFVGIATDGDLDNVEASLREDLAQVETALEEDIAQVEAALKDAEAALKEDLAQVATRIAESEARIFAALESLRAEMRAINTRIDRHLEGHAE